MLGEADVVRLKGGDPMIFGRGGEECETLRAHGIEHEVVNGIMSGLAAVDWSALARTRMALDADAFRLRSPAIAIVGEVASSAWRDLQPPRARRIRHADR